MFPAGRNYLILSLFSSPINQRCFKVFSGSDYVICVEDYTQCTSRRILPESENRTSTSLTRHISIFEFSDYAQHAGFTAACTELYRISVLEMNITYK